MKILLATYWNVPHLGGVWNYMQQLKKSLEERGHEVDLMGYGEENTIVHKVNTGEKVEKKQNFFLFFKLNFLFICTRMFTRISLSNFLSFTDTSLN
jgi:hypothetical protein